MRDQQPTEPVPSTPPLVVFEILSPEDRFSRMQVRMRDFERMGVRSIFVLQSDSEFYCFEDGGFVTISAGRSPIEGSPAYVDWEELRQLRF